MNANAAPARRPVVWAIGGSDCSAAAGLQVDLQAHTALGVHATTIVTAVTAQNIHACMQSFALPSTQISAQIQALHDQLAPIAIKTGMLPNADTIKLLVGYLRETKTALICDPVMHASAGPALIDASAIAALRSELLPLTTLLTPNIPEAEILLGRSLRTAAEIEKAAHELRALGCKSVFIKGGHTTDQDGGAGVRDFYCDDTQSFWLEAPRFAHTTRGTGCALASAATAAIALGHDPADAVVMAKAYVTRGIRQAYQVGDAESRLLQHASWPVTAGDMPWIRAHGDAQPPTFSGASCFPNCEPQSLRFYQIVDRAHWLERLLPQGIATAQLRCKDLTGSNLEAEVERAAALCSKMNVQLFINDHWRLAQKYGAYGVHLGQEDLATLTSEDIAQLRASGLRLGISTHSLVEAARAHGWRPSYVALGPIFATTCKSMRFGPQGFERLAAWCKLLPYPVVAIGGLKVEHLAALRQAGAAGAAVISDVLSAINPEARVAAWLKEWHS